MAPTDPGLILASTSRTRRQMLERGHERESKALTKGHRVCGIGVVRDRACVRHRLEPMRARTLHELVVDRARVAHADRELAARATAQAIDADVGGDAVQPRAQLAATSELVLALPRAQQGVLHGVLGLHARAEHAVAEAEERSAVRLELGAHDAAPQAAAVSIQSTSHWCPSRSKKLRAYMKP